MLWPSMEDVLFGEYMGDRLERLSKEEGKRNVRSHGGLLYDHSPVSGRNLRPGTAQ